MPLAVDPDAESVSVEVPEPPLTEAGLKLAVTPDGNPPVPSVTLLLNPSSGLTVTLQLVLLPA